MSICENLAREGAKIVAISRGSSGLNELKKKLGTDHTFLEINLEQRDLVLKMISDLKEMKLEPDILVNNAGGNLGYTDPLNMYEGWRKVMWLNVESG